MEELPLLAFVAKSRSALSNRRNYTVNYLNNQTAAHADIFSNNFISF